MVAFRALALVSIGRDSGDKLAADRANKAWGQPPSPGQKCPLKRTRTREDWESRLKRARGTEKVTSTAQAILSPRPPSSKTNIFNTPISSCREETPSKLQGEPSASEGSLKDSSAQEIFQPLDLLSYASHSRSASDDRRLAATLAGAAVLIVKNRTAPRSPTLLSAISMSQRVFSLDALLSSVSWLPSTNRPLLEAMRGAIFIEQDEMKGLKRTLANVPVLQGRKRLYVYPLDQLYEPFPLVPLYIF